MLAAEQKASGSRPARKGAGGQDGQGGRQRCGEARQDACKGRCDSPQLLAPAGDLHRPEASLSASAPSSSAVPAARPSPTQQQAAGASMLLSHEASRTHGSSHVQPTDGRTATPQLPELRAGGALCSVWASCWLQGAGIPCWRQLPVCGSPFLSVLSQLPQAGMPRQPPPQLEPLGTAGPAPSSASLAAPGAAPAHPHLQPFSNLGPAPSSPHRSHLGAPAPAGAHWEQGAITPAPQHITSSPGANPRHLA